jgi:hypothetical protein
VFSKEAEDERVEFLLLLEKVLWTYKDGRALFGIPAGKRNVILNPISQTN